MLTPPVPPNEALRLNALKALKQLDTASDERFDRITFLASRLLDIPQAIISLIDTDRQWFKSCIGLDDAETSRHISFCGHAILGDDIFEIPDTLKDERFFDNPLVLNAPYIRFYAGAPLKTIDGFNFGTLCVIDQKPRSLSNHEREVLRSLADWAQYEFSLPVIHETLDKVLFQDAKLAAILNTVVDAIITINEQGLVESLNPAAVKMFGYAPAEIIGKNISHLMPEPYSKEHDEYLKRFLQTREPKVIGKGREVTGKRKDGSTFPMELAVSETVVSGRRFFTGILRDITDRKASEALILQMAQTDHLTGLPNRALFADRFRQAISIAKRENHVLALIYIDLDNFKPINDTFGHTVGDKLLRMGAVRMQNCLRESDTLARVGGDEFVVLLPQIENKDNAQVVAEKILDVLNQPFDLNGKNVTISCSCGISIYPENGADEIELTKRADDAMYQSKKTGRNKVIFAN